AATGGLPRRVARQTGCDPRPSRRTAATIDPASLDYRINLLRSSAVTEDGRHSPGISAASTRTTCCDPRPSRRTAATRQAFPQRPVRRPVALLCRHGGRPPPLCAGTGRGTRRRCDPRPSRSTAATPPPLL